MWALAFVSMVPEKATIFCRDQIVSLYYIFVHHRPLPSRLPWLKRDFFLKRFEINIRNERLASVAYSNFLFIP
jgi:hypothetical protein